MADDVKLKGPPPPPVAPATSEPAKPTVPDAGAAAAPAGAPKAKKPAAPPGPDDGSGGWLGSPDAMPTTRDTGPDAFRTAREARAAKELTTVFNQTKKLWNTVAVGLKGDATLDKATLKALGSLGADQAKKLMSAAKEVAARRAAAYVMTGYEPGANILATAKNTAANAVELVKAQAAFSPPEKVVAMERVAAKGMDEGVRAAGDYLKAQTTPAIAGKLTTKLAASKLAPEYLTNAIKAGNYMKWLNVAAHGLTGALVLYDTYKSVQVFKDPNATTTQKVAGVVTAVADALMFVPFPPLQVAAAAVSVGGALFRDSKHPLKDAGDWLEQRGQALAQFVGVSSPSLAPAH